MQRRLVLLLAGLPALGAMRFARAEGSAELAGLTQRSQAHFRFLGMAIYDIRLWSAEPVTADNWATTRLVLELQYARSLKGKEIAERSLKEMRRQTSVPDATAKTWLSEMEAAFPDVKAGDRISGVYEPGAAAHFYVNGQPRRRVADANFAKLFFGIWLSAQTSEPALRDQLLAAHAKP